MKFSTISLLALPLAAYAAENPTADYESGKIHDEIMAMKHAQWNRDSIAGLHRPNRFPSFRDIKRRLGDRVNSILFGDRVRCQNGLAVVERGNPLQTFRCNNMDYYDFVSHADMGSTAGEGSSMWGWVSRNGREFAAIGQADGTAFLEVKRNGQLEYLGRLPQQSVPSVWREIRVVGDLCIIGSEAVNHGVQIFDMKKLLNINPNNPVTFSTQTDQVGLFTDNLPRGRSHNIAVNWDFGYAIAVGAQPRTDPNCRSGLNYIDLSNPSAPRSPGCASADGYTHDAQCVRYNGPDRRFRGRDICIGYNEDTVTVWDSTNKAGTNASEILSRITYPGAQYIHQGWFIERNWHQFLLLNDELDEVRGTGPAAGGVPVTHIVDLTSLTEPKYTGHFKATDHKAIDHNLYVTDGLAYQSNYGAGIWVHDVRSISQRGGADGSRTSVHAFFDIFPEDDAAGGAPEFVGTWSHFRFPSGYVVVNTIERGAFNVKIARGRGSTRGEGHGGPSASRSLTGSPNSQPL